MKFQHDHFKFDFPTSHFPQGFSEHISQFLLFGGLASSMTFIQRPLLSCGSHKASLTYQKQDGPLSCPAKPVDLFTEN